MNTYKLTVELTVYAETYQEGFAKLAKRVGIVPEALTEMAKVPFERNTGALLGSDTLKTFDMVQFWKAFISIHENPEE